MRVAVDIGVDPATAFTAFTKDISAWYRRGPHTFFDPQRAVGIRFEPATGGTRVTLEHRGLDRLDPEVAAQVERYGWGLLLPWFAQHLSSR